VDPDDVVRNFNGRKRSDHGGDDHQSKPADKREKRRPQRDLPDVRNERWNDQDAGGLGGRHYDAEKPHADSGQSQSKYALNASSEQEYGSNEHGERKFGHRHG
jgi:hypothetical protein